MVFCYSPFKGLTSSRPSGDFIDNIHDLWYWNYGLLESHHGFIQWYVHCTTIELLKFEES